MDFFDTDNSLVEDDVFGKVSASQSQHFKPWHKPRKQFVRDKQWLDQLRRLLSNGKYRNVNSINYFGLPGGDLLDINYLYEGMKAYSILKNKVFGFHGFTNNREEHSKAQGELSKLLDNEGINGKSQIENFNFEDLINKSSEAWARVERFGTYHFINLDFCNNIMSQKTLVSILYLIEYQMNRVVDIPWLLCLTTRLNKDSATASIVERFERIVRDFIGTGVLNSNIKECFAEVHAYILNNSKIDDIEDQQLINQILQIFLILWLLKEATNRNITASLKSSFKYSVDLHNRDVDMHSFVLSFEKPSVTRIDLLGLKVAEEKQSKPACFEEVATSAINKLSRSGDIDNILESDQKALNHYAQETMRLLKDLGYDTSGYLDVMENKFGYRFSSS